MSTTRTKVAVIGTAGRKDDRAKLCKQHFEWMVSETKRIVEEEWQLDWNHVDLCSGSAAVSDHVAVVLFLRQKTEFAGLTLTLEMPCDWDADTQQFVDTGVKYDWKNNPGGTSNFYHETFSRWAERKSLSELHEALSAGAKKIITFGFHNRNSEIAKCDKMIAFGFSGGDAPSKGGTLDTWKKCKADTTKRYVKLPEASSFSTGKRKIDSVY
jgi:hypothetical protein